MTRRTALLVLIPAAVGPSLSRGSFSLFAAFNRNRAAEVLRQRGGIG